MKTKRIFLIGTILATTLFLVFFVASRGFKLIDKPDTNLSQADFGQGFPAKANPVLATNFGRLPLFFIENLGQLDERVKFYAQGYGNNLYFTRDGLTVEVARPAAKSTDTADGMKPSGPGCLTEKKMAPPPVKEVVHLHPMGMRPEAKLEAQDLQAGKINYFIGSDPQKWRTNIPTYKSVVYREAYPGIDLQFYGNGKQLEYDVVVKPGADPSLVKFQYQGIKGMEVTREGDLALHLPGGMDLIQKKPLVYQEIGGQRVVREAKYQVFQNEARFSFGFTVAAYDQSFPLVIDPVLVYSTYLGGSDKDIVIDLVVDDNGQAYVTGYAYSMDFPTKNPYQSNNPGYSTIYVTKLASSGDSLVYSTYLGGSGDDHGSGLAIDSSGSVYVVGQSGSSDFPTTPGAFQPSLPGRRSATLTKLSPNGDALVFSTFLGGNCWDAAVSVGVDTNGQAVVAGITWSMDFPTVIAFQDTKQGICDVFVTKFTSNGSGLIYSTYLGGGGAPQPAGCNGGDPDHDKPHKIVVDRNGCAYVTGSTMNDFPVVNAFQPNKPGGWDAFIAKFDPNGALLYSSYLGGSGDDYGGGIAVDSSGVVSLCGNTSSSNFPLQDALQPQKNGNWDAYITKLNLNTNTLVFSTYWGGSGEEQGTAIALDSHGNIIVTGTCLSWDFPTKDPYQATDPNIVGAYVTKFNPAGNALVYSTLLGGSGEDMGTCVAVDKQDMVYVGGYTTSQDFPVQNPFQANHHGGQYDGFIAKLQDQAVINVTIDIKPGSYPNAINLGAQGNVPVAIFSSETFDATQIDPETVTLANARVQMKGKSNKYLATFQDINGDGTPDLLVHIDTQTLQMSSSDEQAVLEGQTFDGKKIRGVDSVKIVPQ